MVTFVDSYGLMCIVVTLLTWNQVKWPINSISRFKFMFTTKIVNKDESRAITDDFNAKPLMPLYI